MSCIGTAGHVDHGKSALVTALTGMDPDRLVEEKSRGMTIDLGFAWLTLPSGREASLVDVPGHESFIKNMLAGVGGVDAALLVVAADEGVMPQTVEHLAILDLLRVRVGVVALTKCDLVDDADWLALVREDVAERLRPTTLADAPIIPCSARTGAGLPDLLAALDIALDVSPARRDISRPRLPIDRVFTITGFGTVVTGTLQDGPLHVGQKVEVQPRGLSTHIRGLQAHKQAVETGQPGGRLAVNLANVARTDVARGDVLTLPGLLRPTSVVDVRLEVLADAPRPIAHNALLDLFVGAAEVPARVALLAGDEVGPGQSAWAQLRLARPLAVARGDRFILRVPSPSQTIGGGQVVDAAARRHKRHDAATLARLETLAHGNPEELLLTALMPVSQRRQARRYGGSDEVTLLATAGPPDEAAAALRALLARGAVARVGQSLYAAERWAWLRDDALALLADYHQRYPLRVGMPREEWRTRLGLAPRVGAEALAALVATGQVAEADVKGLRGAALKLPTHEPRLNDEQERAVAAMLARFAAEPFAPPTYPEVEMALGSEVAALLVERGDFVRLGEEIVFTHAAYDDALARILSHLHAYGALTVAQARDLLHTSRKYILPLFEHLDEQHITIRKGDDRVLGPNAAHAEPPRHAD